MNAFFTYGINRAAAYFALASFALGHLIFLLYLATKAEAVMVIGIALVVLINVLTPLMLLILLMNMLAHLKDIRQHFTAMFMVLVNIPFTPLYLNFLSSI